MNPSHIFFGHGSENIQSRRKIAVSSLACSTQRAISNAIRFNFKQNISLLYDSCQANGAESYVSMGSDVLVQSIYVELCIDINCKVISKKPQYITLTEFYI